MGRIRDLVKGITLKDAFIGAIIGLVLSAAIQPFAIAIFTDIWVGIEAPGHQEPPLNVGVSPISEGYVNGEQAEKYDGLTWKEGYQTYRVTIENKGAKAAYNVRALVPFPGCIVGISQDTPFSEGDTSLTDPIEADIGGNTSHSQYRCSKIINVDQMYPGESVVVDFVVKQEFQQCSPLVGVHDNPEVLLEYQWRKSSQIYSEFDSQSFPKLSQAFSEFKNKNPGAAVKAYNHHNRTYLVVIPYNISNVSTPKQVLTECGLTLPKE